MTIIIKFDIDRQIMRESKNKTLNHVFSKTYMYFGGVLKIRCPINRQIDILHTDPSALPLHLSLWHTRSIGNVSGRRSKAAVFGFFVLSFRIFLLLLLNNSLVYM